MEERMNDRSELSRPLTADEVATLAPPPESDVESPTTARSEQGSEATGEVHRPGLLASAPAGAEQADTIPNPRSVGEGD
jgi:hypothetical protein